MAAPRGNKNAVKSMPFRDALAYVLANYENDVIEKKEALRAVATRLLENAIEGDLPSIKELLDRTDGKVKTQTEISTDPDAPVALTLIVQGINAASDPSST